MSIGRGDAKKISLIVESTAIDIYEWWEDKDNHIKRLSPPFNQATHFHRSMGISYRWEENNKPTVIDNLYMGGFE